MTDIVRVLRILEYVGPREHIEHTLAIGAVPTNGERRYGNSIIRSAIIGQYPEILERVHTDPGETDPNHGG